MAGSDEDSGDSRMKEAGEDGGVEKEGNGTKNMEIQKVPMYKMFAFADTKDVNLMIIGTIAAIGSGLAMPLMTFFFGGLLNAFSTATPDNVIKLVSKEVVKFVYLAIAAGIASFLQVTCWMISGERQAARIRSLYLKTILRQDIAFFDKDTSTGEVIGRMSGDTVLIQEAIGEKVAKFIQLLSTFLGGFGIAFIRGWLLALVMASCIPLVVTAGAVMSLMVSRLTSRGQAAYAEAGNVVEQTVGTIRTVMSFSGEKRAINKYNAYIKKAYKSSVHEGTAAGLGMGCVLLIVCCSYGLAIWYGSKLIIENGYDGGKVVNVMVAIMAGASSLGQASPSLSAFASGQAAAYKMFETIKRQPTIDAYDTNGTVLDDIKGDIELKDVYFSYPARPHHMIFTGFSLFVPSGTTMALVGGSGSGKSTVISLVERFYDPLRGEVLIDGVNLKQMKLSWIREKIGLVSQEPILFTTTIKENIAYGKEGATDAEIRRALELANAAKFIDNMPSGLDTMVGERGTALSGGQKQRIAIARAILKNPKILLLDEATSALDAESERIVQDALNNIMVNRTTIVVAHRLTTVKTADTITVVHDGKLAEQGSHSELLKNPDGAYSQLVRLQDVNKKSGETHAKPASPRSSFKTSISKCSSPGESSRISFRRSVSKGSSLGESNRLSITVAPGFPIPVAFDAETPAENEYDRSHHGDTKNKPVSVGRLASLNKPEVPILLLGALAAAVHGIIFPFFGVFLSSAINTFYEPIDELRKDSIYWSLMYVGLGVLALVTVPIQHYLFGVAGGKLIERIRAMSFEKIIHQEISWFDDPANSSGAIGARLSSDAATVRSLVGDTLALIVQNMSTIITAVLIAMVANWRVAFVILVLIPLVGLQVYVQTIFLRGFSADAKVMYEEASLVAHDAVSNMRTVASFCAEKKVMETYEKKCEAPLKNGIRLGLVSGSGFGVSFFMLYCTYALCFFFGAQFIHSGKATFPQVLKVFFALTMAAIGVSQTSAVGADTNKAKDSAASIFAILDRKSKIDAGIDKGTKLENFKGQIELQHISFKYPTRPDVQIFKDLCLTIPAGKTVALVGESGSGKSTVISLLERFYDPDSGTILIDGVPTENFNISWLRQQMSLVGQEPAMFNDTIRANIAYGKQDGAATEEEIIAVAETANAHKFISSLPDGYDTNVGERGVALSGGQKQRIAIARAILKDPRILLLDEATSALDAESERVVQDALDKVMVGRTSVVVAHRLGTITNADIIAVVKNGVVAEQGRHETLKNIEGGIYASLVALHVSSS